MPNPLISQITLPTGNTYDIKDAQARADIETIKGAVSGGVSFLGITTTALTDGAATAPIVIDGKDVNPINGAMVIYSDMEFIWADSDSKWHEMGSAGELGLLAYKDSATGNFTPAGTVSAPTFTGTAANISADFTPSGNVTIGTGSGAANYTPAGVVSAPTVTVTPNTGTVNSITDVGSLPTCTLPTMTATVASENLTLGWTAGTFDAGTLPTKGANTSVVTGIQSATATQPEFTGTGVQLTATFSGTAGTATGTFTPAGDVSQPTFTGTQGTVTVS